MKTDPSRVDVMKEAWAGFFSSMNFCSNSTIAAFCCTAKGLFASLQRAEGFDAEKGGHLISTFLHSTLEMFVKRSGATENWLVVTLEAINLERSLERQIIHAFVV